MIAFVKSEMLKYKKTTIKKMIWLVPAATGFISLMLMGNQFGQILAFNMWYTMFLPFVIGYVASSLIAKEKNHLFHGMLGIYEDKKKLWTAKVLYGVGLIVGCNLIMSVIGILFHVAVNGPINIAETMLAMLVLSIVSAWELPLFMLVARKLNFILTTFICTILNIGFGILFALKMWWIPFAIPTRVMCPMLGIYPNGICIEEGSKYLDGAIILPSIVICMVLFVINLLVTGKLFERAEV